MRRLLYILLPLLLSSCLEEGSSHVKYTGWINVDEYTLPDTAVINEYITIPVKGGAPNGCWSNLELQLTKESDSVVFITGTGIYESSTGICNEVYQLIDTVFEYKPAKEGVIRFTFFSPNQAEEIDSVIIVQAR